MKNFAECRIQLAAMESIDTISLEAYPGRIIALEWNYGYYPLFVE